MQIHALKVTSLFVLLLLLLGAGCSINFDTDEDDEYAVPVKHMEEDSAESADSGDVVTTKEVVSAPITELEEVEDVPVVSAPTPTEDEWITFTSSLGLYKFEYPKSYGLVPGEKKGALDIVGPAGKVSIFQLRTPEGGPVTTLGFGPGDDAPDKAYVVGEFPDSYDVWLWYNDTHLEAEKVLGKIYTSLEIF